MFNGLTIREANNVDSLPFDPLAGRSSAMPLKTRHNPIARGAVQDRNLLSLSGGLDYPLESRFLHLTGLNSSRSMHLPAACRTSC